MTKRDSKDAAVISKVLWYINYQTGIILKQSDVFSGLKRRKGEVFFTVELENQASESSVFERLCRFSRKYNTIRVEPNGVKMAAIIIIEKELLGN